MIIKTGADAAKVRQKYSLTQEEFAAKVGLKREAVSRVENQETLTNFQIIAYQAIDQKGLDWIKLKKK